MSQLYIAIALCADTEDCRQLIMYIGVCLLTETVRMKLNLVFVYLYEL